MAFNWIPPPQGTLKINVHGSSTRTPTRTGNNSGIGAVYRDSAGKLRHLTVGVIPNPTPLGVQLWAIFIVLKRAFLEGYRDVIVETDNLSAYRAIRNFSLGAVASVFDIISQIDIRLRDPRWFCMLSFVFPARNRVARYAARVSLEYGEGLYTMNNPIAGIEELLDWDMGLGPDHPDYVDVVLPNGAPDPFEVGDAPTLADNVESLGLGQNGAPEIVTWDLEESETQEELEDVMEENFQGGMAADETMFFAGDLPQVD